MAVGRMMAYKIVDEEAMIGLGGQIAQALVWGGQPSLISLQGNLGVGKTTLSRGVLRGLGYTGSVKSPTYTLVEPYRLTWGSVYHFDLYRLVDAEELEYMGFSDYLTEAMLCLIEWPERGDGFLAQVDLAIQIEPLEAGRYVTLRAQSEFADRLLCRLNTG